MKKLSFLFFMLVVTLSLTSCSDDDSEDIAPTPTKTDLLANTWKFNEVSSIIGTSYKEGESNNQVDLSGAYITFKNDGTYTTTLDRAGVLEAIRNMMGGSSIGGGLEGSVVSETPLEGTWEFMNGETQVLMNKGLDDEFTVDISELTASELTWKTSFDTGTLPLEITFKMTPQ